MGGILALALVAQRAGWLKADLVWFDRLAVEAQLLFDLSAVVVVVG